MSESDSSDSDCGIRFKTVSVRNRSEEIRDAQTSSFGKERTHKRHSYQDSRNNHRPYRRSKSPESKSHSLSAKSKRSCDPVELKKYISSSRSHKHEYKSHDRRAKSKTNSPDLSTKKDRSRPETHKSIDVTVLSTTATLDVPIVQTAPISSVPEIRSVETNISTSVDAGVYGPPLPPKIPKVYGPARPGPSNVPTKTPVEVVEIDVNESDDDVIGPLPPELAATRRADTDLEIRALEIKLQKDRVSPDAITREEWMTELPEVKCIPGLGPRQFRARAGPDLSDRTSWTDTPQSKQRKREDGETKANVDIKRSAELQEIRRRDKQQQDIAKEHNKKSMRTDSLVDIHRKQMAKQKTAYDRNERRPFNRDIDLKTSKMDPIQKQAMFRQAMVLDTKFSAGETKFL